MRRYVHSKESFKNITNNEMLLTARMTEIDMHAVKKLLCCNLEC